MPWLDNPFAFEHNKVGFQLMLEFLVIRRVTYEDIEWRWSFPILCASGRCRIAHALLGWCMGGSRLRGCCCSAAISRLDDTGFDEGAGEGTGGLAGVGRPLLVAIESNDVAGAACSRKSPLDKKRITRYYNDSGYIIYGYIR